MKKIYSTLVGLMLAASLYAQSPEKMSYQAIIRNSSNALVTNQTVSTKISILQGSVSGTVVYSETQNVSTNTNGLLSLEIGAGNVISGNFSSIDWSTGPYFIKTETDPTGGSNYDVVGISQMLSVPYALYAKTSGSSTPGPKGDKGDAGVAGPKGDKGDTGATGEAGPKGDKGDIGATGPQGLKGDKGDTGATGEAGPKGDKGDIGTTGPQGLKGDKGDTGATGEAGPKGDKGDTGATGPQGLKGDKGDTGATGEAGPKGDKGDMGATGAQGLKGDKGDTGATGAKGDKGDTGAQGPSGVSFPTQTGNSGKFLTTDGTNTSWATPSSSGGASVQLIASVGTGVTGIASMATTAPWTTTTVDMPFNVETLDVANAFNTSTYSYTVPSTGTYQIIATGYFKGSAPLPAMHLLIDGSIAEWSTVTGNTNLGNGDSYSGRSNINVVRQLTAGQVLKLTVSNCNTVQTLEISTGGNFSIIKY